jgi:hypothetical protein
MSGSWPEITAFLGTHPALALALAAGASAAGWGLHVWRLRGREQHRALLVDERTRLWQDEVTEHARLRSLIAPEAPTSGLADAAAGPVTRVLVVGDKPERREAMRAAFDELGIAPVFADSHWAATVAARLADADGAPYDLILVDAAMEGVGERVAV